MSAKKLIDTETLTELSRSAASRERLRSNHNLHASYDDPVQRLCIAFEPGTYVRPHRHGGEDGWELMVALTGAVRILLFDESGNVRERVELSAGGPIHAVEIPAGVWHTVASLMAGTTVLEIKRGPYVPVREKDCASWAPPEGDSRAKSFEHWCVSAEIGARAAQWCNTQSPS